MLPLSAGERLVARDTNDATDADNLGDKQNDTKKKKKGKKGKKKKNEEWTLWSPRNFVIMPSCQARPSFITFNLTTIQELRALVKTFEVEVANDDPLYEFMKEGGVSLRDVKPVAARAPHFNKLFDTSLMRLGDKWSCCSISTDGVGCSIQRTRTILKGMFT